MADTSDADPRLEEVQDEVDAIKKRLPHDPGVTIPDPDVEPFLADDESEDDDTDDDE